MHRFCAASCAEARSQLTLAPVRSSSFPEGSAVNTLKLRALPYVGALTVIASLAGYMGGR
jgi:hypothetical protein